jgi:hypothetical protein
METTKLRPDMSVTNNEPASAEYTNQSSMTIVPLAAELAASRIAHALPLMREIVGQEQPGRQSKQALAKE